MKQLLSSTAYLIVNKRLSKQVGLKAAVLLADLISKEQYFINNNQIKDGWFFNTSVNIERDTTLTNYQQKKAIKKLEQLGFIQTELKGMPAKLHFKIIENKILTFFNSSFQETSKHVSKKLEANNNKVIINNNNISFIEDVFSYDYPKQMLQEFYDYWTEPSKKGIPRYKMERTWCTKRRLNTWYKRSKQWSKTPTSKIDAQLDNYNEAKKHLGL